MKYKFIVIFSCFLFCCNVVYGQNVKSNVPGKLGVTFSVIGSNTIDMGNYVCDCGYNGSGFYNIELSYVYPINDWLSLETGIEYSKQNFKIDSFNPNRPTPHITSTSNFTLIEIPLTVRANFFRYLFANAGLLVDINPNPSKPIGNQSGLGEIIGIGAKYDFNIGIELFVNPYLKFHSNVPSLSSENRFNFYESGIRFGILYNL